MKQLTIGILAFHGDVIEHLETTRQSVIKLGLTASVREVRTREELRLCRGLIIPGGESTTLHKLSVREHMWEDMKHIPAIMGTCAGAIMLAREILHEAPGQETLRRMDITVDRNAYGRQAESFEKPIHTKLGSINAVFIRAPKITRTGKNVTILAKDGSEILACEERRGSHYSLALAFHPELTTTAFHEYFIKNAAAF